MGLGEESCDAEDHAFFRFQVHNTEVMDTPIDVPQDANPIIDDNNPRRNVAVRTTVRVRGVYVRLNPPNEQEAGDSPPAVANTPQQQQQPQPVIVLREREVIRKSPRCCYCFLMLPFLLALAALIISVVTFAIKNEDVKAKCSNITCVLNCGESIKNDCWVVLGGEAGLSLITIIYIVLLMCRLCRQSKLLVSNNNT